jgi:hypothetical protein
MGETSGKEQETRFNPRLHQCIGGGNGRMPCKANFLGGSEIERLSHKM